jgi:hypothetical protein
MPEKIDTRRVQGRRTLRFNCIDDALREIDRIMDAEKTGKLQQTGNWTAGQIFGHLAAWLQYAYEGFPLAPPPWFVRWFLKRQKAKYLRDGMPAGVWIPRQANGTLATDVLSTEEGAARLREALHRIKAGEKHKFDSPAFGRLTDDEFLQINLRHAELHMSFLKY